MPYGWEYCETYLTSGMGGRSIRASGLCGRRIGPLQPQPSATATASERITRRAWWFEVRRVILALLSRNRVMVAGVSDVRPASCRIRKRVEVTKDCWRKMPWRGFQAAGEYWLSYNGSRWVE